MAIDFDAFVDWAENRFYDVVVAGDEVQLNSIFKDSDQDHKMWCRPNLYDFGVYHCWKSEKSGTLADLVMRVDGCDFQTAVEVLNGEEPMGELSKNLKNSSKTHKKKKRKKRLNLNYNCQPILMLLENCLNGILREEKQKNISRAGNSPQTIYFYVWGENIITEL
jgi:hypothetical protein